MTPNELAAELGISPKSLRAWLRQHWPRDEPHVAWVLTNAQEIAARNRWATGPNESASQSAVSGPREMFTASRSGSPAPLVRARDASDEAYVIDLVSQLVKERSRRQHTFSWLLGDSNEQGQQRALRVDGYWPEHGLVVEYRELQHDRPTPFFDKPDRTTVSGVHRGEQRRLYDERRDDLIPRHGLKLVIIKPEDLAADPRGRLLRRRDTDTTAVRALLVAADVL